MSLPTSAAISTSAAGSQTTTVTSCQCPHTPAGVATGSTGQPGGASSSGETNKRQQQQQQQQQQLYRAVADYTARHDGELTVRVGDLIGSVRPLGNGWSVGRMHESMTSSTSRDGTAQVYRQAGIFPSLCVVPISTPTKCRPGPDLVDTVTSLSPAHHYNDTFSSSDDQHRHQCPACARDAVSTCDVDNTGSSHQAPSYRQLPPAPPPASGTSRRVVEFADCYEECFPAGGSGGIGIITGSTAGEGVSGQSSRAIACDDRDEHGTSCHVRYRRPPPPPVVARDRRDDELSSGMHSSATAALNTTCGTRSGSPTSLQVSSPRRQQQPKPHLIVKPTRDPSGTDSPGPSTLPSDRTYHSQQQQQQQQQRHQQHLHCNQTGCSDYNRRRCQDPGEQDPEGCCNEHHQYTRGLSSPGSREPDVDADITEDADDVIRTSWCGWRSTGRSNNRTKSASRMATGSILRPSCRQTTMTSSTAQSGGLSGMSTFMGRSDPNLRHEDAEGTQSPSHRHQFNGHDNVDNFCHDDVPLGHQSATRCCKLHYNSQSRDIRSMNLSPSAPDLSFGLSSPSGGDRLMHFRSGSLGISGSAGAGKTILKSRTPRVGDYSMPTLRSGFGSTSSSRRRRTGLIGAGIAACWCRLLVSLIVGLLSGLLTYAVMTYDLEYRLLPVTITSVAVVFVVGALLTASRFCRCVAALIPPTVSTACGRAALCLLAVHLLLAGPATNIAVNTEEAVRSLTCSAELALNRTAGLLRPFDAMMKELDRTVARLEGAAADVARGLKPLDEGLDAVEMDVNNARTQLLGTRRTCKNLVDRAFVACDTGIIKAQSQCIGVMGALGNVYQHAREVLDRINPERWAKQQQQQQAGLARKRRASAVPDYSLPGPVARSGGEDSLSGLPADSSNICEPLSSSQVCRGLNDSDTLCQPAKWAGEAIQEAINGTRLAMRALEKALRFRVTSSPYDMARSQANTSMTSAHEGFAVFESRVHTYLRVVALIRCALPGLVALLLFYAAFRYARSHICAGDTFDNVYIGSSFAQLDRRRYDATGDRLLPLRKHERRHIVDYRTTRMSPSERRLLVSGLCVAALCLCCSLACCTFDQVLYWVLESADESNRAASSQYETGSGINTPLPPVVPESVELLKHQSQSDNVIDEEHTKDFVEHQLRLQRQRRNSPVRTEKDVGVPFSGRRRAINGNGKAAARVADARFWSNGDVIAGDGSQQVADDDETVNGDGVIVDLLDVFVRGFRPDQFEPQPRPSTAVIEQARTAACVPSAFRPSCGLQIALVVLHVVFFVAVLIKPYSFRARPAIAGYFYSERAAERAVHLYSFLVRQRRRMPSLLRRLALAGRRRLVQTIAAKTEISGAPADGRCAAFLRRRGAVDIVRCVVCWDAESAPPTSIAPKSSSSGASSGSANAAATWKFRHCPCGAIYCPECFVDVGRACPLCRHDNGDRLLSGVSGCGGGYLSNDEDDDEDDDDSCNYIDYLTFDEQIDDSPYCCYDDRSRVEL